MIECLAVKKSWHPFKKASVRYDFYLPDLRARDEDNLSASMKPALDGVVSAGLITDDKWTVIRREAPTFCVDRELPRVTITVTEIDEEQ